MKTLPITPTTHITVESAIQFDPWPFADNIIRLGKTVGLAEPGRLNKPSAWNLTKEDFDIIVTMSDGNQYVCSRDDYKGIAKNGIPGK